MKHLNRPRPSTNSISRCLKYITSKSYNSVSEEIEKGAYSKRQIYSNEYVRSRETDDIAEHDNRLQIQTQEKYTSAGQENYLNRPRQPEEKNQ